MDMVGYEGFQRAPAPLQDRMRRIENEPALDAVADRLQRGLRTLFAGQRGRRAKDLLSGAWMGHPLHPAITDVPIGAWTTAGIFDLLTALRMARLDKAAQAAILVGIFGAVGAAASGMADWSDTRDEQRRVGLVHAGLNSLALMMYVGSLRRRRLRNGGRMLAFMGLATSMTSAYLGGHLVYALATKVEIPSEEERLRRTTH